jgi:peptide methionine sulfoxide reductase msrA/msrB
MTHKNQLTFEEARVILHKGTERAFTGEYWNNKRQGIYLCKQCDSEIFSTQDQFESHCGWPSFDDELNQAVEQVLDADGHRIEIVCKACKGHLGHIFKGEGFTAKNQRYCVNSISMKFVEQKNLVYETAYLGAGCFWGVEYWLKRLGGVAILSIESGFMGGLSKNPTYEAICRGDTGHIEVVKVVFDSKLLSYQQLAQYFFEIHNPEQINRQGPDIGEQYQSVIFYSSPQQKEIAQSLIQQLTQKGMKVATILRAEEPFWPAEDYHQAYYDKTGKEPYCHRYIQRF